MWCRRRDPLAIRQARLEAELAAIKKEIRLLNTHPRRTSQAGNGDLRRSANGTFDPGTAIPSPAGTTPAGAKNVFATRQAAVSRENSGGTATRRARRRPWSARKPEPPRWAPYLAAGSIQGLPTLRHERRVARNRFFLLLAAVIIGALGLLYWWRRMT